MNPRIAYVVPTKDRPEELGCLLRSLVAQTHLPEQIIIVDGSEPDVRHVVDAFAGQLPLRYVREYPPSLARQRNAGMAVLDDDITVAGYLDDDLELEPGATAAMAAFWANAGDDIGGASFSIVNQPSSPPALVDRLFLLNGALPGRVLPSAHASSIPFVQEDLETQWLYGGATMWRREVIREIGYDEWYVGHGYLEDLDYSWRVQRTSRLFVVGDARVLHHTTPPRPEAMGALGRQEIVNRVYFARKMGDFSWPAVIWALAGRVLLNLVAAVRQRQSHHVQRLGGNMAALRALAAGRRESFEGIWK